jgi:hypothetical protein
VGHRHHFILLVDVADEVHPRLGAFEAPFGGEAGDEPDGEQRRFYERTPMISGVVGTSELRSVQKRFGRWLTPSPSSTS